MGVRKRFTALLLVIIMLLSNLSFPLQSVVYGFNEGNNESKTINFHGDNLVVNDDGSVTFDCNIEDNQGRITIAVYNSENEKKSAEAQLMWDEQTQTNVPNERDAWLDLETESYEGCYLIVTSDGNVELSTLKFDIAGHNMYVQNEGRVDLPGDVEHINIDENTVRSLYEKKQVRFEGDNLVVNGVESATLDCHIEGNEGRLTFEIYNSDNTKVNINRRMMWNDETQQEEPNEREAEGVLNTTTYEGAYLVVTSDGNVDLADVMFDFAGRMCTINGEGRVYLPSDLDDIIVDDHSMREAIEKKRVEFEDDNLEVNADGTVTMDCNLKNNTGRLTFALYNSDDSQVEIRRGLMWDDEAQHEVESDTRAEGKLKTTTYEGAYLVVTSDGNVDLENVKFDIAGNEVFIQDGGRVDLPNVEGFCIDKYSIKSIIFDTVNVTVNASSVDGNFANIRVNDVEFNIDYWGQPNGPTNWIDETLEVEDRDNDRIIIEVEHGKIVSSVTINDEAMEVQGERSRVEYELPHQDTYVIYVECAIDENVVPEFIWVYNEELAEGNCNALKHARFEIVSVTLPDGITTYGVEDLGFEDTPGIGMHPIHSNAYVEEDEELGAGILHAPAGSTIVVKVVPDEGYIVTSAGIQWYYEFEDEEAENQYSFVMPDVDRCFLDVAVEEDPNAPEIEFADPNFKNYLINNYYDYNDDGRITKGDMEEIEYLYIYDYNETLDISGLENAINLREISINSKVENLETLRALPNLEAIYMEVSSYNTNDEQPYIWNLIRSLENLTSVSISNLDINFNLKDLEGLRNLRNLSISAWNNENISITEELNFENLESLELRFSDSNIDFNAFRSLLKLNSLRISNIKTLSNIQVLNNLNLLTNIELGISDVNLINAIKNINDKANLYLRISVNIQLRGEQIQQFIQDYEEINIANLNCSLEFVQDLGEISPNTNKEFNFSDIAILEKCMDVNSNLYMYGGDYEPTISEYYNELSVDNENKKFTITTNEQVGEKYLYMYINGKNDLSIQLKYAVRIQGDKEHQLDFPDENFYNFLLNNHDIDGNGKITEHDMLNIDSMYLGWNFGINSISGIEQAVNLQSLSVYQQLDDYSPIAQLQKLETLNLSGFRDNDVTLFKDINTLKNLSISSLEQNVNLDAFNGYENLKYLSLSMQTNYTVNCTHLELANLESLNIWAEQGFDLDCNNISALNNLRYITVNKVNEISNVTALNNLQNLQSININTKNENVASAMNDIDERIHINLDINNITEEQLMNVINLFETSDKNNIQLNNVRIIKDLGNFEIGEGTNLPFNEIFMYGVLNNPNSKFKANINEIYEYSDYLNINTENQTVEIDTHRPGKYSENMYINANCHIEINLKYTVSYEGDTEEEIPISDETAKEYLLREHDIDDDEKITEHDMLNISSLNIDGSIRNLDWVKHAKNVEEISIYTYNSNIDFSKLNDLAKLKKVTISGSVDYVLNKLNNPNIEKLTLYKYSPRQGEYDLEFLETMPNLKELYLGDINTISNLEKVKELANFRKLDLRFMNIDSIPTFNGYDGLDITIGANRDLNRKDLCELIEKYNNTPDNVKLFEGLYIRIDLGAIGHDSTHTFEEIMPLLPYLNDTTTKFGRLYGGNYYIEDNWGNIPASMTIDNAERKIIIKENSNGEHYAYLYFVCDARDDDFTVNLNYTICDDPEAENEVVVIPDANLKAYLVKQYDVNGDSELSKFEMERITGFYSYNIENQDVSDITGLEYATNLASLTLASLHLTDLSTLQRLDLSNIEHLPIDAEQYYTIDLGNIEVDTERKVEIPQLFRDAIDENNFLYDSNYKLETNELDVSDDNRWLTLDTSHVGENRVSIFLQKKDYNKEIENNFDLSYSRFEVIYTVFTDAGDTSTEIRFNDQNLKNALLEDYDIDDDDKITEHDMLNIGYLELYNKNITDITGLEHAVNCSDINLYNNNISDISPLMELAKLEWVFLGDNNISDLSCLKNRKFAPVTILGLEENYLDFSNNSQTLTTYLEEMQKDHENGNEDEWLSMSPAFISSIATTQKIGNKQSMNQEVVLDAKIKQKLIELGADANNDGILTRQELYDATQYSYDEEYGYVEAKITELDLSNMNITNISGIEYLTNLRSLNLANNKISDFTPLSRMFNLSYLNLHNTGISDISIIPNFFNNWPERLEMDFSNNKIQDISCLKNWAISQTSVYIGWMAGGDIDQRVMHLNFANNQITDISVINNLRTLAYIDLSNNRVKIISKLKDYNFLLNDYDDPYEENDEYKEQLGKFRGIDLSKNYIKTTSTHVLKSKAVFDNKGVMLKLDNQKAQPSQFLFDDVVKGDWYYDAVKYARQKGIMNGYTSPADNGLFGPEDYITRGQIVTILYRLDGQHKVNYNMDFSDVKNPNEYYYEPIKWAAKNGIVTGYKSGPDQGKFKPDSPISREELAIVLQRYAKLKGKNVNVNADLTQFGDYQLVSDWAVNSLKWAVGVGIISGNKDTAIPTIKPQGQATRAEAATMIMRFCENVI